MSHRPRIPSTHRGVRGKRLLIVTLAVVLAGCAGFAATRPYDRVVTGAGARVTITKTVRLAEVAPNPGFARFLLDVIEPDARCQFTYAGSIDLDPKEEPQAGSRTIVMPAGRAYFRVFIENPSIIENVSFVLEKDQEYSIDYAYLGPGGYDKVKYELRYVKRQPTGEWVPVDVDFWSVCRREKGLPPE